MYLKLSFWFLWNRFNLTYLPPFSNSKILSGKDRIFNGSSFINYNLKIKSDVKP